MTKSFRLSDDVYRQLMYALNAEMERGLRTDTHHDATVKMFHTYVRALPNGSGPYTAYSTHVFGIGADFHQAMVASAPGEKLLRGRRPVRNWICLTISSLFLCRIYIYS